FRDEKLVNGQTYYYQVSAVDLAGNESDRAAGTGIPVAPGPTPVSAALANGKRPRQDLCPLRGEPLPETR
ncbi:MAG: hypothetical protein NT167_28860, partial [Verrucomicrobia bacterium]|nr:hypothetical protein [Verrucomicrobiota bacterium]